MFYNYSYMQLATIVQQVASRLQKYPVTQS